MKKEINMQFDGGMAFSTELDGHKIVVDAPEEVGGKDSGPRPKALMLVALGGCTGMDVVSLLKKMRVNYDSFNVRIEGNLTEEHPKQFDQMTLVYEFSGADIDQAKVEKAVNMSMEKYCGVSAVYRKALDLQHKIVYK